MNKIAQIQALGKRILTAQDLAVLWGYSDESKLFELIKYYVRTRQIFRLARGLYSVQAYNESALRQDASLLYEIANKLSPNSYVSFWTGLKREGVVFQYYDEIYSAAKRPMTREVCGIRFVYKKIKDAVLLEDLGIGKVGDSRVAGAERSIADTLYLYPNTGLESLGRAQKEILFQVAQIYQNKTLEAKIKKLWEEQNVGSI